MAESYDEDIGRHPLPRTAAPPPESDAPYRSAILPFAFHRGGRMEWDPYNSGLQAPAANITRKTMDAAFGWGPPLKSEDIAGEALDALPATGSVRGWRASRFRIPSQADVLASGNAKMQRAMELPVPEYPPGYEGHGALGHAADAAESAFPKGASAATSPEVYAALERFRGKVADVPPASPLDAAAAAKQATFDAKLKTDPLYAKIYNDTQKMWGEAGEVPATYDAKGRGGDFPGMWVDAPKAEAPAPLSAGELVRLREELPYHQLGAQEVRDAIDARIRSGPNQFGFADFFGRALDDLAAAKASGEAAQTPAPGLAKRFLTGAGERLEQGGPLPASLTGAALMAASAGVGMPGWVTGLLGGAGASSGIPIIGRALGGVVKSVAGKPIPQGEGGPAAVAALKDSPLFREQLASGEARIRRPEPTARDAMARALMAQQAVQPQTRLGRTPYGTPQEPGEPAAAAPNPYPLLNAGPYDWVRGAPAPPRSATNPFPRPSREELFSDENRL